MLDYFIGFGKIIASSVSARTRAVLLNIVGAAGDTDGGGADEAGETAINQEMYSNLGLVVRPRPPTKKGEQYTEAIFVRTGDGLVPIGFRDLRLHGLFPSPKEASVALVGYAGAFDSNEAVFNDDEDKTPKSSTRTIYVPYAFQNGVPTKAHAIVIDGKEGNESIAIVHGDGMSITMMHGGKNSVVVKNKAGNAYVEVNDDGVTVNGQLMVNGGASVGSPTAAQPVAMSPALVTYLTGLETALTALLGTLSAPPATPLTTDAVADAALVFNAALTTLATPKAAIPATLLKGL